VHPRWKFLPALVAALLSLAGSSAFAAEPPSPPKLPLWPGQAPDGSGGLVSPENSGLTVHPAPKPNGMAVIICPGGGYGGVVTGPEGHGIARWLNLHGILGVVLEYRLPAGRSKVPLLDAQQALRTVRLNARNWQVDSKRVGIIGFSAGGHLAATASTQFDLGKPDAADPIARQSSRPDFTILIYPVVSFGELGHSGSRDNLLGKKPTLEEIQRFSCERQVTRQTPPAFLAHAADDQAVLIDNSRLYHKALQAQGVSSKLIELPDGGHVGHLAARGDSVVEAALKASSVSNNLSAPPCPSTDQEPWVQPARSSIGWSWVSLRSSELWHCRGLRLRCVPRPCR